MITKETIEQVKARFQPLYEEKLTDSDALEILQSMNALIELQHDYLQSKRDALDFKIVYNKRETKYVR